MSPSTILGYATRAAGQPLEPFTYEPPKLGEYDVRVSISHCGLCYSDIQAIDDYYGITTYPFVPGHEIVGYVSAVGPEASGLKEGDRVGIGWQGRSCLQCEWCLKGEEQLCMDIVDSGTWVPYGGFSSSIIVDSRFAYLLPDAMPSEFAAVLLCAGITVYSPLRLYAELPSREIGIIGVGGLGHLAIQLARALGYEVTAISSSPEKKEEALAFGADHFIVADQTSLREFEFGFDLLLCTAHGKFNWEPLLSTLKKNGKLVLLGFPDVAFNPTDVVAHQLSITGSFLGNRAGMREMLSFAQAHGVTPAVEVMPMSQVNEAIQRVKENKARYRIVLVNDMDDTRASAD
ncbi:MAG: alcohol dehydrogenase catalytic domain-containing protein [Anaerolineae bacterium]|nr:alcohol dehydrogenase catalytic domain-containing protein [Anaerolineae bacterium]NIN98908.1 alcohol dehydrogenase catalytic domain-containing protein [Anaerolineae bacterium]NIQ81817.1 alcohol dehydrogenase catalytic domain-containing protein [Anaerolineae bacterium]